VVVVTRPCVPRSTNNVWLLWAFRNIKRSIYPTSPSNWDSGEWPTFLHSFLIPDNYIISHQVQHRHFIPSSPYLGKFRRLIISYTSSPPHLWCVVSRCNITAHAETHVQSSFKNYQNLRKRENIYSSPPWLDAWINGRYENFIQKPWKKSMQWQGNILRSNWKTTLLSIG